MQAFDHRVLLGFLVFLATAVTQISAQKSLTLDEVLVGINLDGQSDSLKARNIFDWVTANVKYDASAFHVIMDGKDPSNQGAEDVLRRKKAVCEGYANLFAALCMRAGVKCYVVLGYARGGAYKRFGKSWENHAWNAVKIDGRWSLVDPTWGAGYLDEKEKFVFLRNYDYLQADPYSLLSSHYPLDPQWQLVYNPINLEQYKQQDTKGVPVNFNFTDTIAMYLSKSDKDASIVSARRTLRFDPTNSHALCELAHHHYTEAHGLLDTQYQRILAAQKAHSKLVDKPTYFSELEKADAHLDSGDSYLKLIRTKGEVAVQTFVSDSKVSTTEARDYVKKQYKWLDKYFKNPQPL
jgi:hypothetical protein